MFVNLCPHKVDVVRADGTVMTLPPSGQLARVRTSRRVVAVVEGVEIHATEFGDIEGLPAADGRIFIVSGLVAGRAGREDVVSPGELVRGADGQPVGCKGLSRV